MSLNPQSCILKKWFHWFIRSAASREGWKWGPLASSIPLSQKLWVLTYKGELGSEPTELATGRPTKIENWVDSYSDHPKEWEFLGIEEILRTKINIKCLDFQKYKKEMRLNQ